MDKFYVDTVRLLLATLPEVFASPKFALKGGTALNLFVQNMPRLSVDIDVVFTDHLTARTEALKEIATGLGAAQRQLKARGIDSELITSAQGEETKLFVKQNSLAVKVEVNHVFRGTILPVTTMRLNQKARGAFPVSSEKENQMDRRMAALGVREVDIDETFVKSGGHGGQNVNKLATCVMLVHRPTGLQVKCQSTRHQGLNRFMARRLLLDKIEELRTGRVAAKQARIEKIKRQKRKRSRRAKEKMLADKALQSEKKAARRAGDS